MCGIIGVLPAGAYGSTYKEQKIFDQLLFVNQLRGEDATGVFCVNKDQEVKVIKDALDAYTMAYMPELRDISEYFYKEGRAIIGHNRKKTVGANKDVNAHPFVVNDEFVFVHNGTLHQHKKLADTEVDSEALAIHLHKAFDPANTEEDAVDKAFQEVYGAYACVFYDQRTEKLHLIRNKERPLCLLELKNGGYIISSESGFAYAIAHRNDVAIEKAFMLEENHLYTFDLKDKVGKPHCRKLKERSFFHQAPTSYLVTTKKRGGAHTELTTDPEDTTFDVMSKNAFKKFRNKFLGRRIPFIVEDYVERYPTDHDKSADPIDWVLMGKLVPSPHEKETNYPNEITAVISGKTMGEIINMYDGTMFGQVHDIHYNSVKKRAEIVVINPVVPTVIQMNHNETTPTGFTH